jgi:hypothetical protein
MTDLEIHAVLVNKGIERRTAARLIELLPVVYFRAMFANSVLAFSDLCRRRSPDGTLSKARPLSSEPVWAEVLEFSKKELSDGISKADLWAVAARSAEFDATNRLLNAGSKLEDIRLAPLNFPWPEDGPQ